MKKIKENRAKKKESCKNKRIHQKVVIEDMTEVKALLSQNSLIKTVRIPDKLINIFPRVILDQSQDTRTFRAGFVVVLIILGGENYSPY